MRAGAGTRLLLVQLSALVPRRAERCERTDVLLDGRRGTTPAACSSVAS